MSDALGITILFAFIFYSIGVFIAGYIIGKREKAARAASARE